MMSSGRAGSSMVGPQRTTRMLEMFMVCSKNPMHLRLVRLWQWSIVIVHRSFVATSRQRCIRAHPGRSMGQSVNDSGERKRACASRSPQLLFRSPTDEAGGLMLLPPRVSFSPRDTTIQDADGDSKSSTRPLVHGSGERTTACAEHGAMGLSPSERFSPQEGMHSATKGQKAIFLSIPSILRPSPQHITRLTRANSVSHLARPPKSKRETLVEEQCM